MPRLNTADVVDVVDVTKTIMTLYQQHMLLSENASKRAIALLVENDFELSQPFREAAIKHAEIAMVLASSLFTQRTITITINNGIVEAVTGLPPGIGWHVVQL